MTFLCYLGTSEEGTPDLLQGCPQPHGTYLSPGVQGGCRVKGATQVKNKGSHKGVRRKGGSGSQREYWCPLGLRCCIVCTGAISFLLSVARLGHSLALCSSHSRVVLVLCEPLCPKRERH